MKTNIATILAAATALGLIFGCGGGGGGGSAPATVAGRVMLVSTGQPLSGATVSVGGQSFTTGVDGIFTIPGVPSNNSNLNLTITATGVRTLTQKVPSLTPSTTTNLGDIFLLTTD